MLIDKLTHAFKMFTSCGGTVIGALALAGLAAAAPLPGLSPALASDLTQGPGATDDGHFVRLGLHKSAVIKLPAEVKDVIVGDPTIVDAIVRNKTTAYLFARAAGQTNIFFFDRDGRQIMNLDLEVALDMTALQKLIERSIPGSRITVDTINEKVVVGGTAANAGDAKLAIELAGKFVGDDTAVVNAMAIADADQVMLKVRVVEIQRDVLKRLGMNLDNLAIDVGKFALGAATTNPTTVSSLPFNLTGSVGFNSKHVDIQASIQALEQDGVLHTLAEPTLAAISGQKADFLAGGKFPYRSGYSCDDSSSDGTRNCTSTIKFMDYGVKLGFTPIVLSEGRISLLINTEVSDLDYTNAVDGMPALKSRSASTTLELPSGGSMMLAGLIKDVSQQRVEGTPGLKNLPILGALFRSREFQANQTELAVIVTPYVVSPVNEKQLATPIDRFNDATDRQAILFSRLNQVYGSAGRHPEGVYHGNVGYIIE
ncbi:type II and III secretion system protein family protein [Aestuariivirga sp.]|uniref:type II and III secretion system protein family protein n=1 Tax=Aestuariivirga sp. TaxID=2650926 RepID=UPI0039E66CEE